MRLYIGLVMEMVGEVGETGFERADRMIERAITEFMGLYKLYNNDMVDYQEVIEFIDDSPILKDLFIKYIVEVIRDELNNFAIGDYINYKGIFAPFKKQIDETIDGFVDWLKLKGYIV